VNQQHCEERTLPAAHDRDRSPALVDLERTQDPEVHGYARYRREAAVQPACLRVLLDPHHHQEDTMQTATHVPARLFSRTPRSLTIWVLGAVLVAAVAITLALSLSGSGGQPTDPGADSPQPAAQSAPPLGGPRP